jgi:hypothetical protein
MSGESHAIAAFLALHGRALRGEKAIKKFLITLTALAAIVCGAIYVVLSPPRPVIKQVETKPPARLLPYEQQLATKKPDQPAGPQADSANPAQPAAPAETAKAGTDASAPQPEKQAAVEPSAQPHGVNPKGQQGASQTGGQGVPPAEDENANGGMTPDDVAPPSQQGAVPPDDGAPPYDAQRPYDVTAVPPGAVPPGPYGEAPPPPYAPPPYARSPRDGLYSGPPEQGPYGAPPPPGPYGDAPPRPYGNGPYGQGDNGPYGQGSAAAPQGAEGPPQAAQGEPGAPQQGAPQEEWVVVLVSGAGMRATAADDAPMLFAFPYGRNLRVVSHYGDWVEVTDPKSAATGWMKSDEVSPIAPPGAGPSQAEAYDQGPPPEEGGWFRRRRGGFADMINRALGGGF